MTDTNSCGLHHLRTLRILRIRPTASLPAVTLRIRTHRSLCWADSRFGHCTRENRDCILGWWRFGLVGDFGVDDVGGPYKGDFGGRTTAIWRTYDGDLEETLVGTVASLAVPVALAVLGERRVL